MNIKLILSAIVFLFSLGLFSANAFAQANEAGMDIRIGVAADLLRLKSTIDTGSLRYETDFINYDGFMGKVSIGYRWAYGGIYIDQDLGGVWFNEGDTGGKKEAHFLGGTFFVGRGIIPLSSQFQIDLGIGIGAMYGHGDKFNEDDPDADYKPSLIVNDKGNPSAALAFKLTLALAYYFSPNFAMGVFCDYDYAFKVFDDKVTYMDYGYHVITPGIQVTLKL